MAIAESMEGQLYLLAVGMCDAKVLPVLMAATHLFAYNRAISYDPRAYLANTIQHTHSQFVLYISFDHPNIMLQQWGVQLHGDLHWSSECDKGGVHVTG